MPFADTREHIRAELAWLDRALKRQMRRAMGESGKPAPLDEFAGLYVSEEEIRGYLEECYGSDGQGAGSDPREAADAQMDLERRAIDGRIRASLDAGVDLRLPALTVRFGLDTSESRILIACLAPDVDIRFQRCFAYLQNDVTRKRPSVQFLTRLIGSIGDVLDARVLLGPEGSLVRHGLLLLPVRSEVHDIPFPIQQPVVAPNLIDYLLGLDRVDDRLVGIAHLVDPRPFEDYGTYSLRHQAIAARLLRHRERYGRLPPTYISGPPGSHRSRLVELVAREAGFKLLRLELPALLVARERAERLIKPILAEARLHGALVHIASTDGLMTEDGQAHDFCIPLRSLLVRGAGRGVLLSGTRPPGEIGAVLSLQIATFQLPYPSTEERSEIWSHLLDGTGGGESRGLIDELASKFKLTPGQIRSVVRSTIVFSDSAVEESPVVRVEDLHRYCREASNRRLESFARKIEPRYGWEDIVLPAETRNQLREIHACVKYRHQVYGSWGFDAKLSLGKGLNVLFAGPSGTGKTMGTEVVARALGLGLYKIDLSGVVSKYVGETERNLQRIFDEAESSNSILFFDEADAVFGKRSEVKDAHDRYANIEINYLLQKMDEYEGIVFLATNLKGNLDPAFMRRLAYVVDFPAPDADLRRLIWERIFPEDLPLGPDVDYRFLAQRFQLTGGNIKNIALNSAFMAAGAQDRVSMSHLILATKREYHKLGKLCAKSDFGPYLHLVREEA